jgi:diketogulonate reductase-like aldo/keto reductase
MERCVDQGKYTSIGLSDIGLEKLQEIVAPSALTRCG